MTNERKTSIRYSVGFKRRVVNELEAGETLGSLRMRYGINGGQTIQRQGSDLARDARAASQRTALQFMS